MARENEGAGRSAASFDGEDLVRRLTGAGGDERAERKAVGDYLAELSEAARGAKLDALRSGVAEARARREKEKPPPDWWTLANGIEQKEAEVGREWRLRAKSVAGALEEFAQADPGKDRAWLRRDIAALKSPEYDPFAERRGAAAEREPAATVPATGTSRAAATVQVAGTQAAGGEKGKGDRAPEPGPYKRSLAERLVANPEHPETVIKQAVHEYLEEAGSKYLERLEKALDASLRTPAAKALAECDAAKREFRETERTVVVQAAGVKEDLKEQPARQSAAREPSPAGPADATRERVGTGERGLGPRSLDAERAREAQADMEGGPRAFAAGVTYRLGLQVAAARGEDALARMGERIEGSTRAQAGLRTVGADPLLVAAAADAMARKRGDGSSQVTDVLEGWTAEPVRTKTAVLAVDMLHAHRRECSEFPDRAAAKEEVWERGRRTLAAGPAAESAARGSRTWGAACAVEIAAARGGRVEKAPPEGWKPGPGMEGLALSNRGRAAVAAARKTDPAALRQHDASAGPVVEGTGRGSVRSLAGRRAEGFNRVRQLADGLPGRVMAPVSRRLVTWAARGDVTRLKRVGAVIGRSKWLSAGVVAARVDPALVAVAVSRQCATSLAAGKGWTPRAGDNRRLSQLAVEAFERHDRRESGGAPGEREAREERFGAWRDGVSSGVAKELREVHAGWDRRKNHEWCEFGDRQAEAAGARAGRDAEVHDDVGRVRNGEKLWAQPSVARTERTEKTERKSFSELFTRADVPDADGGRVVFTAKAGVEPKTREVFAQLLQQSGCELAVSDQGDGRIVVEPSKRRVVVDREALRGPDAGSVLLVAAASAFVAARSDGARVDRGDGLTAVGMVASRVACEQGLDYQPPRVLRELSVDQWSEKAVAEGSRHARAAADLVASRLDGRDRPSPEAQSRIDEAHAAVRRAAIGGAHDRVAGRELDQGRVQSQARDVPRTQTLNLPAMVPAR